MQHFFWSVCVDNVAASERVKRVKSAIKKMYTDKAINNRQFILQIGFGLILSASQMTIAHAAVFSTNTSADAGATWGSGGADHTQYNSNNPGGSQAVDRMSGLPSISGAESTAESSAFASIGAVHVLAKAMAQSASDAQHTIGSGAGANATASYSDLLTLRSPGLRDGTLVVVDFNILVSGAAEVNGFTTGAGSAGGQANWSFTTTLGNSSIQRYQNVTWSPFSGRSVSGNIDFGKSGFSVTLALGEAIPFGLLSSATAVFNTRNVGAGSAAGTSLTDLSNTVAWGGDF
ncbi:MAG: hypothetical protein CTY19_00155 [Methylomonas sp.]|nr:MAG: hypothetical protein CTY19_00155 [Methylomonas sp.]